MHVAAVAGLKVASQTGAHAAGHAVVIGHVKIENHVAMFKNRFAKIRFLHVHMESIDADAHVGANFPGQGCCLVGAVEDAGLLDFGFLLGAAGVGYFLGAMIAAWLERHLREEPMVVAGLAIEAAAAFIAAQAFGLVAGAALAAAACAGGGPTGPLPWPKGRAGATRPAKARCRG